MSHLQDVLLLKNLLKAQACAFTVKASESHPGLCSVFLLISKDKLPASLS